MGVGSHAVRGSGMIVREERAVAGAFTRIESGGAWRIDVRTGEPAAVAVEADENLLPLLETVVADGELVVRLRGGSVAPTQTPRISVTMPRLDRVRIGGATKLAAEQLDGSDARIETSGAAEVSVADVQGAALTVTASGASEIRVAGRTRTANVTASGSSRFLSPAFVCARGTVELSGASRADFDVGESLDASLSGASRLLYGGGQPVDFQARTSGAATVSHVAGRRPASD